MGEEAFEDKEAVRGEGRVRDFVGLYGGVGEEEVLGSVDTEMSKIVVVCKNKRNL